MYYTILERSKWQVSENKYHIWIHLPWISLIFIARFHPTHLFSYRKIFVKIKFANWKSDKLSMWFQMTNLNTRNLLDLSQTFMAFPLFAFVALMNSTNIGIDNKFNGKKCNTTHRTLENFQWNYLLFHFILFTLHCYFLLKSEAHGIMYLQTT